MLGTFALSIPGSPDAENEDAMVVTRDVVIVVDGAGLPKSLRAGCDHSVAWFARSIAETFHATLTTRSGTMPEALADAIRGVRDLHAASCDLEAGSPAATVAAWRCTHDELEYLVLCDASLLLVDGEGRATQITDRRLQHAVDRATRGLIERSDDGASMAGTRRAARVEVDSERNREGGWWCVNDDPAAAAHALIGAMRPRDLAGVIACSDGATRAFDLLSTHTLDDFAALCLSDSAEKVAADIRQAETSTTHVLQADGTKTHDDITIVASAWSERFR